MLTWMLVHSNLPSFFNEPNKNRRMRLVVNSGNFNLGKWLAMPNLSLISFL